MKHGILFASTILASIRAFDPGAGWKKDDDGKLVLDSNGNPIYVDNSGRELSVQGDTISRLNNEAKQHREAKEAAENKLKAFEGIDDADAARKAIDIVSKLDAKKLIDAGEVDKVRHEIGQQYQTQIAEKDKAIADTRSQLDNLRIENAFGSSEFIRDRVAVPAEMFRNTFARNFKVEDGKVVPYYPDGNVVYSKKNMGAVADINEAFELIVDAYPHKDAILKPVEASGSGSSGNAGGRGRQRTISRAEFDKLDPMQKNQTIQQSQKGEVSIVD